MPAVSVADITVLPRIKETPHARARTVKSITTAPQGFEGEGFPVRRAFAGVDLAELDPFIHLDQMGEVEYAPGEPKGTPWHPHRGFETVTYVIDGIFDHKDNNGGGGTISDGDTQWMTAGAGILHIETPPESLVMSGGLFHGFQLWVNLPAAKKWSPPAYQDVRAKDVALLSSSDGGSLLRVIAGEVDGHAGPGTTQTPITLIHATIAAGAELRLPWRRDYNALVYTMAGHGFVGDEERPVQTGQLTVFGDGDTIVIRAANNQDSRSPEMELFILGGAPIKEPVAWMGPFVMNTKREVLQAFEDFQKGLLGSIPAIYKEDAKNSLNRSGAGTKLGADSKPVDVLDVHGAPRDLQQG
jgi:redox-sensitive bicupin YhaK (pirin superfamily)